MWFIQPKQDYVAQMPWKHTDEPAVMTWQIRARDYYTLPANILFFVNFSVALGVGYLMFQAGGDSLIASLLVGGDVFISPADRNEHDPSNHHYRLSPDR